MGVLRDLGENFPEFQPKIFTGISAGSINACFLAQGEAFPVASRSLYELWAGLEINQVFETNFRSLFTMLLRWTSDLFFSKCSQTASPPTLLDATPLSETLLQRVRFWKITRAVRAGIVEGLAISATNYHSGVSTIFYDSTDPIEPWVRSHRVAVRTTIRIRHIMASCSIPILFHPVRIGDFLYGDGSLRFSFPFSPAIHLGATHIFSIGIRCPTPENALGFRPDQVSLGFVAGAVLNSIFLDSLDSDYESILRMNRIRGTTDVRQIPTLLVKPTRDLGALSRDHLDEVPFHFRQLLRSTASPAELGDLLSYLMFRPSYIKKLLELGMADAKLQHAEIAEFVKSTL